MVSDGKTCLNSAHHPIDDSGTQKHVAYGQCIIVNVIDGLPVKIESPTDAIRAGIALLPESRKEQGLLMNFAVDLQSIVLVKYPKQKN